MTPEPRKAGNTLTVEAFVADMNNGGVMSQAITGNTTAKRTPRAKADANYRLSRLAAAGAEEPTKT